MKLTMPEMYGTAKVGEKGQVVIPAEIRKVFKIKSGDKLVVFAKPDGPIGLMPAQHLTRFLEHATDMLSKIKKETA